ncbi:MAG: acyl-CoA dehydrogenase [Alphaproteobacteria bacterium]|nr:acyl-CoA dehydrogenase [Alphaproteobacteria bacterium]
MSYTAPVQRQMDTLKSLPLDKLPQRADVDDNTIEMILTEASKLTGGVLAPLNRSGDQEGTKLSNGVVTTAPGFKDAYTEFRTNGWGSLPFPQQYGGQGLPWVVSFPVSEMVQAANLSFGLGPLLTQGAAETIDHYGTQEQKDAYLPKMVSGEWTGTMNLTEPHAGTDLGALTTKAIRNADGSFGIVGQKIFITWGEHDVADNIIHLVLARIEGAPAGVKGISLFIVPKILEDGTRNDLLCTGIEEKMGIHASPTCTMQYGDNGGAKGYLLGAEGEGLKNMFTMMNNARLHVGLQGVGVSERALQMAKAYAEGRVQGTKLLDKTSVTIDKHADVFRMLQRMEALTAATRALAYQAAYLMDMKREDYVGLLTPIVKSYCTDMAQEVTALNTQVHGGMGFIEESGAPQLQRDARILTIYEGTNGVQAMDLMFRKMLQDKAGPGVTLKQYAAEMLDSATATKINEITDLIIANALPDPNKVAFVAVPYQSFLAIHFAAAGLSKVAGCEKLSSFFNAHVLPDAEAHAETIRRSLATPLVDMGFDPN